MTSPANALFASLNKTLAGDKFIPAPISKINMSLVPTPTLHTTSMLIICSYDLTQ